MWKPSLAPLVDRPMGLRARCQIIEGGGGLGLNFGRRISCQRMQFVNGFFAQFDVVCPLAMCSKPCRRNAFAVRFVVRRS